MDHMKLIKAIKLANLLCGEHKISFLQEIVLDTLKYRKHIIRASSSTALLLANGFAASDSCD